jgi:hypothetical protein
MPRISWILIAASVLIIVTAALYAAIVITTTSVTNVTAVNWSNPSGFCLPSTTARGFKAKSGEIMTLSLSVPSASHLQGCYVQSVAIDTSGFSLVSSPNAPGMVGTWEPLNVAIKSPDGSYSGPLDITVNVMPVQGDTPVPQLAMASSNFQINGTTGTLFAVFVNVGNSTVSVNHVIFDSTTATNSNSLLNSTCTNVASEDTCGVSISFGPSILPVPAEGSDHQLNLVTSSEATMSYGVTAGALWEASWASEA